MARIKKLIEKMKNRPNGMQYDEVATVLTHYGYLLVRRKGSHSQFRNETGNVITIPMKNPLKAVYVKDVLERIGE